MAQSVVINEITYSNVPKIQIPKSGGGTAEFIDVSDATLDNGNKLRNGVTGYGADGTKYTGSIQDKSAQTYTPTTSDQTIASGVYLTGVQTIKGDQNLTASNIAKNVTIFNVTGTLSSPVISQDGTTKVLSIS